MLQSRGLLGRWQLIVGLVVVPVAVQAQGAALIGRTLSDSTKEPLAGVEVVVDKINFKTETDSTGRFTISNLDYGVYIATIRKIGYRPVRLQLMVASTDTTRIDIRLKTSAVELPPIEVTATSTPVGMEDFARRRLSGWGQYWGPKELRQNEARRLSDLFVGARGVRLFNRGFRTIAVSARSNCALAVWLDGLPLYTPGSRRPLVDLNDYPISQLDGVEIYSGSAETPIELAGSNANCGAVVLWTRRN